VASNPGGLSQGMATVPKYLPAVKSLSGFMREADPPAGLGESRRCGGRNRHVHPTTRRDAGPSILGKTCRDNVGKGHHPAGAGSNLHGPADRGQGLKAAEECWSGA